MCKICTLPLLKVVRVELNLPSLLGVFSNLSTLSLMGVLGFCFWGYPLSLEIREVTKKSANRARDLGDGDLSGVG